MDLVHRIKPKHLELLLRIAETGQLQVAARDAAMSQPAASRILANLENTLDAKLFERHPLGMELTPAGHVFVRHARVVLSELRTLGDELQSLKTGALGNVRIGAVTGPAVGMLMPALQSILQRYPDLNVSVDVAPSSELMRRLDETRYDFVIGRAPKGQEPHDYRLHPGRIEKVKLLVHETHPLAGATGTPLEVLHDYSWVMQDVGNPIREAVEGAFISKGLDVPPRVLNSSSLLVGLAQVANGDTIAPHSEEVVNLLLSEPIGAKLATIPIREPIIVAPYFVIQNRWRKLPRAVEMVLEEVLTRM
ncbi:LysR family transcriptional regulator [Shimia biformata]|uniref:LysR family transcriptional regulator n=1 Tax=Shimia biformata TaxID=1294299 RepID=UPI0019503C2B|nr:LysR substrate-binding domain-containing protein [Shimia biformata]